MSNVVDLSIMYIANPTIGRPISNGDIYVGEVDTDPKVVLNQKQISVLQENGTTVDVNQPISTSAGGVPLYNGSPVTILVDGSYSLRIDDSTGAQIYYVPKNAELEALSSFDNIADLRAISETPVNGDTYPVLGYYTPGDGGGGQFYWDAASTETDNGGTIIKVTSITTGRWLRLESDTINALQWGAVADSATGTSQAVQDMMDNASGKTCIIPYSGTGTYVLDPLDSESCLKPPANTKLIIEPGVTLIAEAGIGLSVRLIFTVGNNVEIIGYGATLTGIKSEYTTGEDRHGISASRTGFVLKGLTIEDTGGDGIYIGESSRDVYMRDVKTDNVRRNGLSVIACTNFLAENCSFENSVGADPQMGVDVEPNNNTYNLTNIVFLNCYAQGNENQGFNVSPAAMKGVAGKILDVSFIDCIDIGSGSGFGVQELFVDGNDVDGAINFIRCTSHSAGLSAFSFRNYDALGPRILVENPVVVDCNTSASGTDRYAAPISVWNEAADTGATNIGNVTITNPSITYTGVAPSIPDFYFGAPGAAGLTDVHLIDPIKLGNGTQDYYCTFGGTGSLSDKYRLMIYNGVKTINGDNFASIYQNTGAITYTLSASPIGFPELIFEVTDQNDLLTIDPDATSFILPGGVVGGYARALDVGAKLRIRRLSATQWAIVEQIGTWTFEV